MKNYIQFNQLAHIVDMGKFFFSNPIFIVVGIGILLLFFPVYLTLDGYYDLNRRKIAFAVRAYKSIKLFGGYIATYVGGIAIHLSKKKAVIIPYMQLNTERKRFSFMRAFHLKSCLLTTETGAEYIPLTTLAHTLTRAYYTAKGGKIEGVKNRSWITNGDVLKIALRFTVSFNLFIVLKTFLAFLKEKLKGLWLKKVKN